MTISPRSGASWDHQLAQVVRTECMGSDDALKLGGVGLLNALTAAGECVVYHPQDHCQPHGGDHLSILFIIINRGRIGLGLATCGLDSSNGFFMAPIVDTPATVAPSAASAIEIPRHAPSAAGTKATRPAGDAFICFPSFCVLFTSLRLWPASSVNCLPTDR